MVMRAASTGLARRRAAKRVRKVFSCSFAPIFLLLSISVFAKASSDRDELKVRKLPGQENGGAVLDLGKPGAFDSLWVSCPSVIFNGRRYLMWYSSFYDSHAGEGGIGMATSADGIHWTRTNEGKPVFTAGAAGAFDDGQVMGPQVLARNGKYYMWYTGMNKVWHRSGIGFYRIGLARSRDGIHWIRTNHGRPVLDVGVHGSYDEVQVATPSILYENGQYRMWYAAWAPATGHTICVARSADGITWRKEDNGHPVAGLIAGGAYGPLVHKFGSTYLMLYMPAKDTRGLNAAISKDGYSWRSVGDEPLLPAGNPASFDAAIAGHACLLQIGDRILLWYTGYRREPNAPYGLKLRIGAAELKAASLLR